MANSQSECPEVLMDDPSYIMDDPQACMGGPIEAFNPSMIIREN